MTFAAWVRNKADTLASWTERVTHVDVRRFAKDLSWLYSGQVVGIATALLLAIGYSHFLTKETYGTYKYVLAIFGVLTVFSLPGMSDAAQRAVAQGKEGVFWKTFRKRVEWGTVGGLVSAGIGFYYFTGGNTLLAAVFLAASPFIVCIDAFTQYNALLMGRQMFRESSLYNAAVQIIASIVIFLAVLLSRNLIVLIVAYLSAFVFARLAVLLHVANRHPLNKTHDKDAISYGAHISINSIISLAVNQLDSILLWHFLGPVALAVYAFAEAAADQAQKAFKLVTTSMAFPKFSATDKELLKKTLPRKILLSFSATIPLALALVCIIPFVYGLLFPQYTESIPYAQVMALILLLMPIRFFSTAIAAKAPMRMIYTSNIVGAVSQAVLLFVFIPLYGIWGAILGTFLSQIITSFLNVYLFYHM